MNDELLSQWLEEWDEADKLAASLEPTTLPKFEDIGMPVLNGLSETEWWFLFEQIRDLKCQCKDAGYQEKHYYYFDSSESPTVEKWWEGTVITPGGDEYRVTAADSKSHQFEMPQFKMVEKI